MPSKLTSRHAGGKEFERPLLSLTSVLMSNCFSGSTSEKYSRYESEGWPAKRNRIQEKYESRLPSFLLPFCQNVVTKRTQSFRRRERLSFPATSAKWRRRYKSRGSSTGDPVTKVQKQSNPPISGLKLKNKLDQSRAMPEYVPGVNPRMATDKCITILGWTHLQYTSIAVVFARWSFLLFLGLKTTKNSSGKVRQLYTYVVNESTLIEENTKRTLIKFSENNVRARKLNEPAGFLVSSLNNSGAR